MFSSLLVLFEEYPALANILSAFVILGAVGFVLLMVFNIKSFLTYHQYRKRFNDKNKEMKKEHSTLFWIIDGFFTFFFSLDFLSLIFILL